MISISTGWRSGRIRDGAKLADAMADVGAKAIELEYRITAGMLEQMLPRIALTGIAVSSIHNYFPVPDVLDPDRGSGDAFMMTSDDRDERELAVTYGIRSLEAAARLGAPAVVFHLSKVQMDNGMSDLKAFFDDGRIDSGNAGRLRRELLATRRGLAPRAFERVLECLDKLVDAAGKYGVIVGIENRYHPNEIPDFAEMDRIFDLFEGGPVAYWHDVGHAVVQERLGFIRQKELLEAYGSRMAGIHIHDVVGHDDHWAPGTGEVDFTPIVPHVPRGAARVIEVHSKVSREELISAVAFVEGIGLA